MAKNAATHPSPATSSASQPAASRPTLAPVIEINVRHIGRTPHPEKLIGGEAPEGWIKKIDRPREGKVWVGFFHLYVADRVMYVPPIVKRRIEELGIGRGELFTLTKAEKKNGTRCTIEWLVDAGDRREKPPRGNVPTATGQRPAHSATVPAFQETETVSGRTQPTTQRVFL